MIDVKFSEIDLGAILSSMTTSKDSKVMAKTTAQIKMYGKNEFGDFWGHADRERRGLARIGG